MQGEARGRGRALVATLCALLAIGLLAVVPEEVAPAGLNLAAAALGLGLLGVILGLLALRTARRARLAALSAATPDGRIATLETRLAELTRSGGEGAMASDMGALSDIVRSLAEALSTQEREIADLRQRMESAPRPASERAPTPVVPTFLPDPPRIAQAEPAGQAIDAAETMAALEAGQIDLHVQPIVTLPQRRALVHDLYALLRLGNGDVLVPSQFVPVLARLGLTAALDERVLDRAIATLRELARDGREGLVACTLSRRSLSDPAVLDRIEARLEAEPAVAGRLILEVTAGDWPTSGASRGFVVRARDRGVGFALSGIEAAPADPAGLAEAGIRYVKIAAARLHDPARPDETHRATSELATALASHGIRLVAERVEDDGIVPELIDAGVPLAQGFAFALPAPIATLVGTAADASPAAPRAPDQPGEPDGRRSLRAFLRRAV